MPHHHHDHALLPLDLDARDPNFGRDMPAWACQMQCDIHELIAASKETIADSRTMMATADRVRDRK